MFTVFVNIFRNQGFSEAIVQRDDLKTNHLDTAFWTGLLSGLLLMICTILGAEYIGKFFDEPRLAPVVSWLSLSFIFGSFSSIQEAVLRREFAFKSLAIRALLAAAIGGAVGIGMALNGYGVWSLVAQILVTDLVNVIVLWKVTKWRPGLTFSTAHFKELFTFGIGIAGSNLLDFFSRRSDQFLVGYFLGPTMLGYYTIAFRLLQTAVKFLTNITNAVAFPVFSRLQNDRIRMRQAFYNVTQMTGLAAFPVFGGMAVLAPEIITAFFGEKWQPSIPVLQALAFMGIIYAISFFIGSIINAAGKPAWRFAVTALFAVCNTVALLFIVKNGITAVAIAYTLLGYLLMPVSIWIVRRLITIDLKIFLKQFLAPLGGSILMVTAIWLLKAEIENVFIWQITLPIYVISGGLLYLGFIHLTARSLFNQIVSYARLVMPGARDM